MQISPPLAILRPVLRIVVTSSVIRSIRRMLLEPASRIYRADSDAFRATSDGLLNVAARPIPFPFPATPLPAMVDTTPVDDIILIR